jgi:hypothetical protein
MPTVKQFGFATGAGVIANIVDGNLSTFWQPLATGFDAYPDQFMMPDDTALNYAGIFPAVEWDFGESVRVTSLFIKVETALTLGPAILVGSENPATSTANTLQAGDVLLAVYSGSQIVSNLLFDIPVTKADDLRFRYYRLLQRSSNPAHRPTTPLGVKVYDSGSGNFSVEDYTDKFIIEVWGAGASGGVTANAQDGGNSTVATYSLVAEGGNKASQTTPNVGTGAGTGGAASGGNTANVPGGDGSVPSPPSVAEGISGKGGDAPFGSEGGAGVLNAYEGLKYGSSPYGTKASSLEAKGIPGQTVDPGLPGGGGSGRNIFAFVSGGSFFKYPGGGAGGYVKHVLTKGIDGPDVGDPIAYVVGAAGVSSQLDGAGAAGRVKFSWT